MEGWQDLFNSEKQSRMASLFQTGAGVLARMRYVKMREHWSGFLCLLK